MTTLQGDGSTIRETLEKVWAKTGERPPELVDIECPDAIRHVWEWFKELHDRRESGIGSNPISYQEIMAWSFMTGREPSPFEVGCITAVDTFWITSTQTEA